MEAVSSLIALLDSISHYENQCATLSILQLDQENLRFGLFCPLFARETFVVLCKHSGSLKDPTFQKNGTVQSIPHGLQNRPERWLTGDLRSTQTTDLNSKV